MSSSSIGRRFGRARARATLLGAALIVIEAAVIGLAANAVNPHRLPWIRVPLRETHRVATALELRPSLPPPSGVPPVREGRLSPSAPAKEVPAPGATPLPATGNAPVAVPVHPPKRAVAADAVPPVQQKAQASARQSNPGLPAVTLSSPKAPSPKKAEALFTSLKDAKALFDAKNTLFIDARHHADYAAEHVAGARNIFAEDVDSLYDGVLDGIPKDRTIVTYCSDPQCDAAIKLADALVAHGHTRVFILLDGIPGWRGAGYPTTKGETP